LAAPAVEFAKRSKQYQAGFGDQALIMSPPLETDRSELLAAARASPSEQVPTRPRPQAHGRPVEAPRANGQAGNLEAIVRQLKYSAAVRR